MKKSKFLKKSLAMLLAVMLVVAMIPLSASAAALPTLEYISVDSKTVQASGTNFSATYDSTADPLQVVVLASGIPTGVEVDAIQANGYTTQDLTSAATLTLSNYSASGTTYTIPIRVRGTEGAGNNYGGNEDVYYTLTLTPATLSTENGLTKVEVTAAGTAAGVLSASLDTAARTVDVVVAYGYTADSNNAEISVTPVETAKVGSNGTKGQATGVDVPATGTTTFSVVPESGATLNWTVSVTKVPAITALSVAGVEGVFSDESDNNVDEDDTITVTLDPEDIADVEAEANGDYELPAVYSVLANTTVEFDGTAKDSGDDVNFGAIKTTDYNKTLTVKNGSATKTYTLKVAVTKSSDNSVQAIWVDGIAAAATGTTYNVTLDAGTLTTKDIIVRVAKGASIPTAPTGWTAASPASDLTNDEYDEYYYTANLSTTRNFTFNVVAADQSSKQYTLNIAQATAASEATLTSFTLEAPDGTQYNTTINGNTITTAPIPYMTTSIADWTMIAATSDGSRAILGAGESIRNRETEFGATAAALTNISGWTDGKDKTIANAITVRSQGTDGTVSRYNLVITFATASTNHTLSGVTVTAQNPLNSTTEKDVVEAMDNANTYRATVNSTDSTVTIKTAYSHSHSTYAGKYLVSALTTGGGVAYAYTSAGQAVTKLNVMDATNDTTTFKGSDLDNVTQIIVLPESVAKVIDGNSYNALQTGMDDAGTIYTVKWDNVAASNNALLSAISVGDTTLTVSGTKITGTIPYGMTVSSTAPGNTLSDENTYFLDYTISDHATLSDGTNEFNENGIPDGATEPGSVGSANAKVYFVRSTDNKVVVHVTTTESGNASTSTTSDSLVVDPEETAAQSNTYTFDLKYADANTEAAITSFKLGNFNGSINGRNITVNLPFGANLYGQVATFTTSEGAKVYLGSVNPSNLLTSGESVLNVSSSVTLKVQSEAKNRIASYTLTVTTADQFSDVDTNDWFYNNVMRAVELGILSGYTDGTFKPMNNITRRDFAIMLAQSLGHDNDEKATSPFKDVADTDYGVSSIAYLYENEITVGDSNGNFNPDANITRQEAAIMLVKAFEATGTSSDLYADDAQIASWAKSFVYTAKAAGLMKGDDHNEFNPTDRLTRAEAASAMVNAMK